MSKFHCGCPRPRPTLSSASDPSLPSNSCTGFMFRYPTLGILPCFSCVYRQVSGLESIPLCPSSDTHRSTAVHPPWAAPFRESRKQTQLSAAPPPTCSACSAGGRGQRAARRRPTLWTLLASRPPEGSERRRAAASPGGGVGGARALRHASCFLLLLLPKMAADSAEQFCVAEERSGHCAVVDGNFLYVWGGYVVRREEAGGGRRGRAEKGREERESERGTHSRAAGGRVASRGRGAPGWGNGTERGWRGLPRSPASPPQPVQPLAGRRRGAVYLSANADWPLGQPAP